MNVNKLTKALPHCLQDETYRTLLREPLTLYRLPSL